MKKSYVNKISIYADTAIILSGYIIKEKLVQSPLELLNISTFASCIHKIFRIPQYENILKEIFNTSNKNAIFIFKDRSVYASRFVFDSLPYNQMDSFFDNSYPTPSSQTGNIFFDSTYDGFFKKVFFSFNRDATKIYLCVDNIKIAQCNTKNAKKLKQFFCKNMPVILDIFHKEEKLYDEEKYNTYFINKYKSLMLVDFNLSDINIQVIKNNRNDRSGKFYLPAIKIQHSNIDYCVSYMCNQHLSNKCDFSINYFLSTHLFEIKEMKRLQDIFEEQQILNKQIKTKKAQKTSRL